VCPADQVLGFTPNEWGYVVAIFAFLIGLRIILKEWRARN